MFLLSLLLTALFHLIAEFPKASMFLEKRKEKTFQLQKVQIRFNQTFYKYFFDHPFFYDKEKELVHFSYDNGVDIDPAFGAGVLASFGMDKNHFLILEITSMVDPNKKRKEILLEGIDNLTFSFFCPVKKKWKSTWSKKYMRPPPMLRIAFTYQHQKVVFSLILPQKEPIAIS